MKDKIICLIGESGAGKTAIAQRLEAQGFNVIKSYTTRSPRTLKEGGHIFVDKVPMVQGKMFDPQFTPEHFQYIDTSDMIAYTFYDGHHYWATRGQYQNLGMSIYVVDPVGVDMLLDKVQDADVILLYLKADKANRIDRMSEQGRSVQDVGQRIGHDQDAFRIVRCHWIVDANGNIDEVIRTVSRLLSLLREKEQDNETV